MSLKRVEIEHAHTHTHTHTTGPLYYSCDSRRANSQQEKEETSTKELAMKL
jgi:hypothetical protein